MKIEELLSLEWVGKKKLFDMTISRKDANRLISTLDEEEFVERSFKKEGMFGSKNPMSKTIYKFDLTGKVVKTYGSAMEIATEIGWSRPKVTNYCNTGDVLDGFVYSYKNKFVPPIIEQKIRKGKTIGKYKDGILIKTYCSVSFAAKENNIDRRDFYKYIKSNKSIRGNVYAYIPS